MPRRSDSRHRADVPRLRRFGTVRLRALLGLGVVGVLGATGTTFAAWTDTATIAGASVSAGRVDLTLDAQDNLSGYTALNLAAMVPGNSVAAVISVKNAGTAPLAYSATSTGTGTLAGALTVKVTGASSVTGTAPASSCSGAVLAGAGSTLGGGLIGNGRLLPPGASETVCVQLTLPSTALSSLQGATATVGLTFTGSTDLT